MRDIWNGTGRTAITAVLALALAAAGARACDAVSIDRALKQRAPEIKKYLLDHSYKNVGVLKFLAAAGDGKLRDDLGAFNRTLADRLEVALVLSLDADDEDKLSILTHASDVVKNSGDHRTEAGRAAFFGDHPLAIRRAWVLPKQSASAPADAFLTGEAVLAPDCKTVTLRIEIFGRDDPKTLHPIGDELTAAVDPRTLTECDVSYAHKKGAKDDADDTPTDQVSKLDVVTPTFPGAHALPPAQEQTRQQQWQKLLDESPVKLEIRYNGDLVTIQEGSVPTPGLNDKVTFTLENNDPKTTYGVVLKINGESTIEHQTLPPLDCYKWVLAPGKKITIDGYQRSDQKAEAFKVLAPEASKDFNYGENTGVFSLVVFREATPKEQAAFVHKDEQHHQEVKAISRGSLATPDAQPPQSLLILQDALTAVADPAQSKEGKKGLIVAGPDTDSPIEHKDFVPFPREELSLVVHYYQP